MVTATPKSVIVYIDDERVELTGKEAVEFEKTQLQDHQSYLDMQSKKDQAAKAKAALLTKLGITAEEAVLLLS